MQDGKKKKKKTSFASFMKRKQSTPVYFAKKS